MGDNQITATYSGTIHISPANTTGVNVIIKKAKLYLYTIDNSTSTAKITGKLLDDGKAISEAKLTLNVNNKDYTVTPGSSRNFSYKITAIEGTNNITATFNIQTMQQLPPAQSLR